MGFFKSIERMRVCVPGCRLFFFFKYIYVYETASYGLRYGYTDNYGCKLDPISFPGTVNTLRLFLSAECMGDWSTTSRVDHTLSLIEWHHFSILHPSSNHGSNHPCLVPRARKARTLDLLHIEIDVTLHRVVEAKNMNRSLYLDEKEK